MPDYRRFFIPNSIVFITCVTKDRYPYLKSEPDINLFFETLARVKEINPFELLAYVVLPDHLHWLMKVNDPSGDFSKVMHSIKRNFTRNYKHAHNVQRSLQIWQRGYWDHVIRDEQDLELHLDYIHWNPIKHGYVNKPEKWQHSSYYDWTRNGFYEIGWGWDTEPISINGMDFE
jgi:putative transposase